MRRAIQINSLSGMCLTKLDVLDGLEELKICTGYKMKDGSILKFLQWLLSRRRSDANLRKQCLVGARTHLVLSQLMRFHKLMLDYIKRIEDLTGVPIDNIVSTGPDRNETIIKVHPYSA